MKDAKITDSVSMKAIIFLEENRVIYPQNLNMTNEIVIDVYGEHSGDLINPESETPYIVILRKNGEHSCSCENNTYRKNQEYKQFWGDIPIRSNPECSHVLATKLHPNYFLWMSNGKKNKKNTHIKSKLRTGKRLLTPTHSIKPTLSRTRRNVNISDLIRNRKKTK